MTPYVARLKGPSAVCSRGHDGLHNVKQLDLFRLSRHLFRQSAFSQSVVPVLISPATLKVHYRLLSELGPNGGAESLPDRVYHKSIRHLLQDGELWRFQRRWLGLNGGGYERESLVTCRGFGGDEERGFVGGDIWEQYAEMEGLSEDPAL